MPGWAWRPPEPTVTLSSFAGRIVQPMRVNRRLLYSGLFLIALGAVLVTARLVPVDTAQLELALRWWPVAFIAVGLGIAVRRTPAAVPAGIAGALLPGLVLGGTFLVAPDPTHDCDIVVGDRSVGATIGDFTGPPTIILRSSCGSIAVRTAPGSGWRLESADAAGRAPRVVATETSLVVETTSFSDESDFFKGGRDELDLTVPAGQITSLDAEVGFGTADLDLSGAQIDRLALDSSGSTIELDASEATIAQLAGEIRFSYLSLRLPTSSDTHVALTAAASGVFVCAPSDLGVRIEVDKGATEVQIDEYSFFGGIWTSPNYATAAHRADIVIDGSFSNIELDLIGGCG